MGVSIGPPVTHYATDDGVRYFFSECQRPSGPGRDTCLYCGEVLDVVVSAEETPIETL